MKARRDHWPALWLLLILALVAVVRIRLVSLPLERDEGEYAYAGQLMIEGVPPYQLAYNMKMPGIYAAYALIMSVFGQSAAGIHLGFMLVNFGAIVLLYFIGRRFLDRVGAVAACAAYALLSLSPHVFGLNAHATHFVVLAALGGTLLLLRAQENARLAEYFASGALFGVAFLMKQPGGAFAVFGATMIVWAAWRRKPPSWKTEGSRLAIYSAGVAAPIILTGLMLWRAGVWDRFWWWTVTYARAHVAALPWAIGQGRLFGFFKLGYWDVVFWMLALAGLVVLLLRKNEADEKFFFLSLLFFSIGAVVPTFHFTAHYFVLMLPVIALLAARLFAPAASWLAAEPLALARGAAWIFFSLVCAGVAWSHFDVFLLQSPQEAGARMFPNNDFQVYPVIANYMKGRVPSKATLAILGSEPELPFYLDRRSITGYIYMYDLVQDQPFHEKMEGEMMSEVEQGRPDFIVFVNNVFSWLPFHREYFDEIQSWAQKLLDSQYQPYGVVTFSLRKADAMLSSPPNQFYWGPDCFQRVPPGHRFVVIYQRKSSKPQPKSAP